MTDYEFSGDSEAFFSDDRSRSTWETARRHREIVTKLLSGAAKSGGKSLCILGAGPCNDVVLKLLASVYEEVTLVDKDSETLRAGVKNQCGDQTSRIKLLDDVDLFGASDALNEYKESQQENLITSLIERISNHQPNELATYDCVASTCLLSQLLNEASSAIHQTHDRFVDILRAVRLRHIEIMYSALNPGGQAVLITDIVSSESLPDLASTTDLKGTLRKAIANQNFLHGLNPPMIVKAFRAGKFDDGISPVKVSEPWLWNLPERTYACFAIKFSKTEAT